MHGRDAAQVEAFLAELRRTQMVPPDVLERSGTSLIVRVRNPRQGVVSTILGAGCTVLWPAAYAEGIERYSVLATDRARLDELLRRLRGLGEVAMERVVEVPPEALNVCVPLADITSDLTERQLAVLQRAIGAGYYASPRRTSTEALAETFGVSRSTFEEHLRKAERRVLERFADALADQPVLARKATRRAGRPPRRVGL